MDHIIQIALEKQNPWWFGKAFDTGISRLNYYPKLQKYLDSPEILVLIGARRTGKSTLLYQLIKSLNAGREAILFLNLDEPLFQSKADDPVWLGNLIEEYLIQHKDLPKLYVFIDEVQSYEYWVQTVKMFDQISKRIKFILTGSTSALLKTAVSSRLSGRYFTQVISPLGFLEYLDFAGIRASTILQKMHAVNQFLQFGGFPRVVLEKDEQSRQDILKNYFQTIYVKDIILPHEIRNNKDVFELLYFVISNTACPFSYASIGKTLGISPDTVSEYLGYAEESYILHAVMKYSPSVRQQLANQKKIYCVDTGLVNAISFRFSENKGKLIENLVFTELLRRQSDTFYHKGNYECDFIIREGRKIVKAIQVTVSLQDESVSKRELKGLLEAMNAYSLSEGTIVTESERENLDIDGKKIQVLPLYDWLEHE